MPVIICSSGKLKDYLPAGLTRIDISSLNQQTDVSNKYVQVKIRTKYQLNTYSRYSIKLVLECYTESLINLHAFGPIATDLDSCAVGDTLALTEFEIDICPKDKRANGTYQIILDDLRPVKSVIWVVKASKTTGSGNCSTSATATSSNSSVAISSPVRVCGKTSQSPRASKIVSYTYTSLTDVTPGTVVHIYGVVSFIKPAMKTSGSDYYLMISVVDPSLSRMEERLVCNLFNSDKDKLPTQGVVGDIVRIHRLKIQKYQGDTQGRSGPGCHWVLFQGSYENRVASSDNYTLQDIDKDRVCELLTWWRDSSMTSQRSSSSQASGTPSTSSTRTPSRPSTPDNSCSSDILDQNGGNKWEEMDFSSCQLCKKLLQTADHLVLRCCPLSKLERVLTALQILTPMKVPPVIFKTLAEVNQVSEHTLVNLYAVIIYCRPVVRTVCSDYHLMLNITDSTLGSRDAKMTCNLFDADRNKLPCQAVQGDVIRIRDLNIRLFRGKRQGMKGPNFEWVLFQQSFDTRVASRLKYNVKEDERAKVNSLLEWWQEGPECTPFDKVEKKQYFNLVCQVILNVHVEEENYRLIKVWDGTKFNEPLLVQSVAGAENDNPLAKIAGDLHLVHDLLLYDNHIPSAQNIKPGDFITLTNLHAAIVNNLVEMTLHGGTAYQRGVKRMKQDHPAVKKLKAFLDSLIDQYTSGNSKKYDGSNAASMSHLSSVIQSSRKDDSNNSRIGKDSTPQTSRALDKNAPSENACQSSVNPPVDVIIVSDSSSAPLSLDSSDSSGTRKRISISDSTDASVTSNSLVLYSVNSNTSAEFDQLTLPSSIPSPSASLNLTEKDEFIVKAIVTRQKDSSGKDVAPDSKVLESGRDRNTVADAFVHSGMSVTSDDSLQLSMYGSASNQSPNSLRDYTRKSQHNTSIMKTPKTRLEGDGCSKEKATSSKRLQSDSPSKSVKIESRENMHESDLDIIASSQESFYTAKDPLSPAPRVVPCLKLNRVETRGSKRKRHLIENARIRSVKKSKDKTTNSSSPKRSRRLRKADSGSNSQQNIDKTKASEDKEMDEITSSQDSYHTAPNLESPILPSLGFRQSQSPAASHRKHLTLRSQVNNNEQTSAQDNASNWNLNSQIFSSRMKKALPSSSVVKETGNNTVSSSADSLYSLPNDRQQSEIDNDEISSSTDSKNSSRKGKDGNAISFRRQKTTVTVTESIKYQARDFFKLHTFIRYKRPTKLKTLVRVCNYSPCTGNMPDFVKLRCSECNHMVSASETRSKRVARCPSGCGALQAHICVHMRLSDGECEIEADILGQNAVEFFQGITAKDLLHKASAGKKFRTCLDKVCPLDTELEDKPLVECCVFSYVIKNKIHFQIFDTVII